MITKFYKGRLGLVEALEQPIGFIHLLYNLALKESMTDEGKNRMKAEAFEDVMGV